MKINIYRLIAIVFLTQIFSNFIWLGFLFTEAFFAIPIIIAVVVFAEISVEISANWNK